MPIKMACTTHSLRLRSKRQRHEEMENKRRDNYAAKPNLVLFWGGLSRNGTRSKSGGFGDSRLPDQPCAICFEVGLHSGDPAQTDRNPLLALEQPIVGERFTHFHDFYMLVVHLPKLAFGQRNRRHLPGLDSFCCCRRTFYHCKVHFHTVLLSRTSAFIDPSGFPFSISVPVIKTNNPQNHNQNLGLFAWGRLKVPGSFWERQVDGPVRSH
jgi:hypothetical protein